MLMQSFETIFKVRSDIFQNAGTNHKRFWRLASALTIKNISKKCLSSKTETSLKILVQILASSAVTTIGTNPSKF